MTYYICDEYCGPFGRHEMCMCRQVPCKVVAWQHAFEPTCIERAYRYAAIEKNEEAV